MKTFWDITKGVVVIGAIVMMGKILLLDETSVPAAEAVIAWVSVMWMWLVEQFCKEYVED